MSDPPEACCRGQEFPVDAEDCICVWPSCEDLALFDLEDLK